MEAQLKFNKHKRPHETPSRTMKTTTSAFCSDPTGKNINGPEDILIEKHQFKDSTALV